MPRKAREERASYDYLGTGTEPPPVLPPVPNYTAVPNVVFDYWLSRLTYAELKVYLYLIRRIRGFHKDYDNISLGQIANGLWSKDRSHRLDDGAGLSESNVRIALNGLISYGLVSSMENWTDWGARAPTTYTLNWDAASQPYIDAITHDQR